MKLIQQSSIKKKTALVILCLTIISAAAVALVSYQLHNALKAEALVGFNAGNIITDSKMSDFNSMNEDQIRSFIHQKNAACAANNAYCFKNYREGNKDTATLIYEASREQRINPQVILSTIQKEQGLVTRTNPAQWMYNSAMGYNCPDSTPGRCGSDEQGFLRQIIWGSTMYRAILDGGQNWGNRYGSGTRWYTPYIVGRNDIQWNPNLSCGKSSVIIENRATQALYNYTPYRPNNASLNAGYGEGDGCSSYGNRNFFLYMRDWFGYVASANAYTWRATAQDIFSDAGRTQRLSYDMPVYPGQTIYAEVKALNTGGVTWFKSNTLLATDNARDRASVFADSSWLRADRAAQMVESQVAPGETATFRFSFTAPSKLGSYVEHFNIVLEGQAWLAPEVFYYPFTVINARSVELFDDAAYTTPNPPGFATVNKPVYARVTLTNTSLQTWPANARIATTDPDDRGSALYHPSWISGDRVTQLGREVKHGESITIPITLAPTDTIRTVSEKFGLVIDGSRWIERNSIIFQYTTRERPLDTLALNESLNLHPPIVSGDEKYTLVMQGDGNLVLYSPTRAVWASNTVQSGATKLVMQGDGNLVLYSPTRAVWASNTAGR